MLWTRKSQNHYYTILKGNSFRLTATYLLLYHRHVQSKLGMKENGISKVVKHLPLSFGINTVSTFLHRTPFPQHVTGKKYQSFSWKTDTVYLHVHVHILYLLVTTGQVVNDHFPDLLLLLIIKPNLLTGLVLTTKFPFQWVIPYCIKDVIFSEKSNGLPVVLRFNVAFT